MSEEYGFSSYIVDMVTSPVRWFWTEYKKCIKKKRMGKAIGILLASLTGLLAIALMVIFITYKFVVWATNHPTASLVIAGIVALYFYVFKRMEYEAEDQKRELERKKIQRDDLKEQAIQGYSTMLNVVYQVLRTEAENLGGIKPTFSAEVEMPDEHYVIKSELILYQFKLEKVDYNTVCDDALLAEYRSTLQYRLRMKLNAGEFPSVQVRDFRNTDGTGLDGIIIDHIEDFGRYYVIYTAYASEKYVDYRRYVASLKGLNASKEDLTQEWTDR